ncbi:MAG TPA: carbohydrate binding family 9 domain-containing protein [Acidobacteriaceae bacterium]
MPTVLPQRGEVKVPMLTEAVKLSDFAGMEPRAELRNQMAEVTGFVQQSPNDGRPATEQTEVWLGQTKSTLYAVFICHDRRPAMIRGHLARRENVLNDDRVSILLDTFHDRRRGILFTVNPAGVQADAAWTEGSTEDYSFDQVWDSEGRVTKDGWMALVAIPFRSLRFRLGEADWGVVLMRYLQRNSEVDYWPQVSANVSGVLTQEGTLHGIASVTGSHNVQINPYVLGQSEKTLVSSDPFNPYFSSRRFEGTAGGEAKAVLWDSVVLDATVNPDFSDVESDQPQFTVNQRYPVYFPELRPFFLENANYFATPITLLYTRNIIRPEYGARVTGKIGNTNVGLLMIDDREPGQEVPKGNPLYGKHAAFAVGRVSQDFGKNYSVGLIYADEEFGEGWNRTGGVDFIARVNERWTVTGQAVESSTSGTEDGAKGGFPAGYSAGPASYLEVNRSGHAFNMDSTYQDFSSGFQTMVGFVQTLNIHNDQTHATYQWYPKHSVIQSFGLETNQNIAFDHQGNRVYHYSSFDPFVKLTRKIVIAPIGGQNSDTVGPQDGYAMAGSRNFTENFGGLVTRGQPYRQMNFDIQAIKGGNVNYNPVDGATPSLMNQEYVEARVTVAPLRQLTIDNTYLLDRDHSVQNGALVYESQTYRTKINYQFTRALSARVIVEYDSTLANELETSLPRTKQVQTQVLLTWLPHPGTAIYAGYNSDIQNLSRNFCTRLGSGECDPNQPVLPTSTQYLNDGRQFFVKASYLLRF